MNVENDYICPIDKINIITDIFPPVLISVQKPDISTRLKVNVPPLKIFFSNLLVLTKSVFDNTSDQAKK